MVTVNFASFLIGTLAFATVSVQATLCATLIETDITTLLTPAATKLRNDAAPPVNGAKLANITADFPVLDTALTTITALLKPTPLPVCLCALNAADGLTVLNDLAASLAALNTALNELQTDEPVIMTLGSKAAVRALLVTLRAAVVAFFTALIACLMDAGQKATATAAETALLAKIDSVIATYT